MISSEKNENEIFIKLNKSWILGNSNKLKLGELHATAGY